jgi:uncharacterized membrane protein
MDQERRDSMEQTQTQEASTPETPQEPGQQATDGAPANEESGGNATLFGILGYLFPILFFLPLVTDEKNNEFSRYHANQQLVFLLYWVVASAINIIPILGQLVFIILWIFGIVLLIMGIVNVVKGVQKPLPVIGGIELIK